jgi:diaminohydroxyphosphoribosylaminopyrimidine deaminase/5-amino-6-(5-phosphoribosylamino)uracil reductase
MDYSFMKIAYDLAVKGYGKTSPNPCVGALIVKNNKIIGEGWHKKAGEDHAEIVAIKSVKNKNDIKGSELYVTLEPCNFYGKTPPCCLSIIKYGIKKVFIGMKDPFDKVNGDGIKFLKSKGVKVEILNEDHELAFLIRMLNQPFIKSSKYKFPYVILKAGISLDGKITDNSKKSQWITNEFSREDARFSRSLCDCVVVGANTVLIDDSELKLVDEFKNKTFFRVIIDRDLSLSLNKKIFKNKNVIIISTNKASQSKIESFEKAGIEVKVLGEKNISVLDLLKFLNKKEIQSVFVEGGSQVFGLFHDASLKNKLILDQILFYIAPVVFGGKNALPVISGDGVFALNKAKRLSNVEISPIHDDLKYKGFFNLY